MATIPDGYKESLSKFDSLFDKESVLDDDKELWLIRIPDNLTEEDLTHLTIHLPNETPKASKKPLAKYEKSGDKYALYTVPTNDTASEKKKDDDEKDEENEVDLGISGHEMLSFDCLLPSREENGKLAFAPKNFDKYLILNQEVDIPDTTIMAKSILEKPVYKREQPEGLKMRYKPYGYYSGVQPTTSEEATTKMDTSGDEQAATTGKGKKRRADEEETADGKVAKKEKKEKKEKKDKKKSKKEKK